MGRGRLPAGREQGERQAGLRRARSGAGGGRAGAPGRAPAAEAAIASYLLLSPVAGGLRPCLKGGPVGRARSSSAPGVVPVTAAWLENQPSVLTCHCVTLQAPATQRIGGSSVALATRCFQAAPFPATASIELPAADAGTAASLPAAIPCFAFKPRWHVGHRCLPQCRLAPKTSASTCRVLQAAPGCPAHHYAWGSRPAGRCGGGEAGGRCAEGGRRGESWRRARSRPGRCGARRATPLVTPPHSCGDFRGGCLTQLPPSHPFARSCRCMWTRFCWWAARRSRLWAGARCRA